MSVEERARDKFWKVSRDAPNLFEQVIEFAKQERIAAVREAFNRVTQSMRPSDAVLANAAMLKVFREMFPGEEL